MMTSAPSRMPRLRPGTTIRASSGLAYATRRMNPKYSTIIAMVSAMAIRQRASSSALSCSVWFMVFADSPGSSPADGVYVTA